MVKKALKRFIVLLCIATILMTAPGLTVLADDISIAGESISEELIVSEMDESVSEESVDKPELEEAGITEEEYLEAEEASINSDPAETFEEELPAGDEENSEDVIGAGETVTVGDGVTAKLVTEGDKNVLYFDSKGGTLWNDWKDYIYPIWDITSINVTSGTVFLPEDSSSLFAFCTGLTSIDLSRFNTSKVVNMQEMFWSCNSLKELDLKSFDTANVRNMSYMFGGCESLTTINISSFDTSNVTDMRLMFIDCPLTSLDLSSFRTSNVKSMENMFSGCKNLKELDLSGFDTSNVTNMSDMFNACTNLTDIDLSGFNTESVNSFIGMFSFCTSLKSLNLSHFNTSGAQYLMYMFDGCQNLTDLDLSSFYIGSDVFVDEMLKGCACLSRLRTPVNYNTRINLPVAMYDESGYMHSGMPVVSSSIFLIKGGLYADISACTVTLNPNSFIYSGNACQPLPKVMFGDQELFYGNDYDLRYTNNVLPGTASVVVTGTGRCSGVKTILFAIEKMPANIGYGIIGSIDKACFDPPFTVPLSYADTDGQIVYKSSDPEVALVDSSSGQVTVGKPGTVQITAEAKEGLLYLAGSDSYTLSVSPCSINNASVSRVNSYYEYTGKAHTPSVTVTMNNEILKKDIDYTVGYVNNKNAGTAMIIITGKGKCTGSIEKTFHIKKAAPKLTFASTSVRKTTSDSAFTNVLTKETDGRVTFYSGNPSVAVVDSTSGLVTIKGTGTTTITVTVEEGMNYYPGSAGYELTVSDGRTDVSGLSDRKSITNASVAGVSLSYGYTGKAYTPALTVKLDGVTLTKDTDYNVKYENNQNPGTAKITVTGKGKYSGTKTKTFEIVDCVSSVVSGKTYLLIPKNNSKTAVCAYAGKMVNNTKIYITDRGNSESQKFKAVKNSDGTWKFINAKCELALAVQQNSSELGAGLVLYDQTTKPAQNWKLSKKADNSFAIINSVTGYSIAMSDKSAVKGTTLSMAETASVGLQRFYIVETSAVSAPFDGTKSIRAAKDKSFSVNIASASKAEGANVSLYTYTNSNARKFNIIYSGGGYYRLVNVNSGLCLTIKDNSDADGANVIQSKWKGYSSQRWKITKNSDGTVTITNMLGTVLHLLGNRTVNNTNIHARKAASTTAQKWYLN